MIETLLVSTGVIALSEIGDKTQLLALVLTSRFRRPVPIILGIALATVLNHTVAAWAGARIADAMPEAVLRWILGLLFLAMAIRALIPERIEDEEKAGRGAWGNAFLATAISFFLVEIGDKTQIATAMLAAHFHSIGPVIAGTTVGMLLADVPAVIFGHAAGKRFDLRWIRYAAAGIFVLLGLLTIFNLR